MKKTITLFYLLILSAFLYAQDGAEHKITQIIGAGRVEINVGEQFEIKKDDIFQVFGKGQVIHPATGKLVERDNVYLGKIKVLEVKELTSIAEIIEKKGELSVGNKLVKVVSADQQVVENKRPVQAEFENPKERNYSETIYTQKDKKAKPNKDVHIIEIKEENNQTTAIIDKGKETKAKGKPEVGKEYFVFVPIVDTSSITGQQYIEGEEYIGKVKITSVEHDASTGNLSLHKKRDYSFIEKDNLLRTYVPKNKGWHHILRLNILSVKQLNGNNGGYNYYTGQEIENEKAFSPLNGVEFINGYRLSPVYYIGFGLGFNTEYHKPFIDAKINNMPFYLHQRFNVFNRKNSLSINTSIGKNAVLNATHDIRPYDIQGKYFLAGGLGLKTYIKDYGALLIDVDWEWKFYNFENYFYQDDNLMFLKLKLGFEFNYSPLN